MRFIDAIFSVSRRDNHPNEVRWLIYLGPPSCRVGAVVRYATDGGWKEGKCEYPFFSHTPLFYRWRIGSWMLWIRTALMPTGTA